MRFVGIFLAAVLMGHAWPALADRWTEAEVKALPPYCQARLGDKNGAEFNHWRNMLGPDFEHTHHYCYGLIYLNRYYGARTPQGKKQILQSAQSNLLYLVQRVNRGFPVLPEAYLSLGTVLSLQGKDNDALQAMLKAVELDPKLARAYTAAANQYAKLKKPDDALKLATEGLRQVPGHAGLQRLYDRLGGKPPYPEAAAPAAAAPATPATPAVAAEPATQAADAAPAGANTPPAAETAVPPPIGSPSNPWCRFCPPEPER